MFNDKENSNTTVVYRQSTICHSGIKYPACAFCKADKIVLFMPNYRYNNKKGSCSIKSSWYKDSLTKVYI